MRNISWCPCLNSWLNFYLGINNAGRVTVCDADLEVLVLFVRSWVSVNVENSDDMIT